MFKEALSELGKNSESFDSDFNKQAGLSNSSPPRIEE